MAHQLSDKNNTVLVIGGINMDIWGRPSAALVPRDSAPGYVSFTPGGVGRNIAHDMRLLGMDVSLAAALGDDPNGQSLRFHCQQLGIDMSLAPTISGRASSSYLYITDEQGEMTLAINEMDICKEISPKYLATILPEFQRFSALVLDANLREESIAFICEHTELPIYADPVSTVKGAKFLPHLKSLRAFKPNLMEAQSLTGKNDPDDAALKLVQMGVDRVFISLGADGMIAADRDEILHLPVIETNIVNTNGAGDAATAAIVWADRQHMSLYNSARAALLAGAITCRSEKSNSPELGTLRELINKKL